MEALVAIVGLTTFIDLVYALPPPACFANFRWDDCGRTPEPVMYYWKPGSRCEVGIWRGCLPNINMFRDEYECVSTCIFSVRALPPDFHKINLLEEEETTPFDFTETESGTNGTDSDNATTPGVVDEDDGGNVVEDENSTVITTAEPED